MTDRFKLARIINEVALIYHCKAKAGTDDGKMMTNDEISRCMWAEVSLHELARKVREGMVDLVVPD